MRFVVPIGINALDLVPILLEHPSAPLIDISRPVILPPFGRVKP